MGASLSIFCFVLLATMILGSLGFVSMCVRKKHTPSLGSIFLAMVLMLAGLAVAFWAERLERTARHARVRHHDGVAATVRHRDLAAASEAFDRLTQPRIHLEDGSVAVPITSAKEAPAWGDHPVKEYESGSQLAKKLAEEYDADYVFVYRMPVHHSLGIRQDIEQSRVLGAARRYVEERSHGELHGDDFALGMEATEIYDRFVKERQLVKRDEDASTLYTLMTIKNDDGGDELYARTRAQAGLEVAMGEITTRNELFDAALPAATPVAAASDPKGPLVVSPSKSAPAWVETPPAVEEVQGAVYIDTYAVGPYSTPAECVDPQREQLVQAIRKFLDDSQPAGSEEMIYAPDALLGPDAPLGMSTYELYQRFVKDRYLTESDSSILPMYTLHTLVVIDERGGEELIERTIAKAHSEQLEKVGVLSCGVLGLLALAFGLLKLDESTKGYYTGRLLIGVPAAIMGVLGLLAISS